MTEKVEKHNCNFSGQIVAYIYNEMLAAERESFDDHLPKCSFCIDELAGLSNAAFSLREWKDVEFAPLSDPVIELPSVVDTSLGHTPGSFDGFRAIFQVPRLVGAGFSAAAIVGILVLAGLVFDLRVPVDVAVLENRNLPAPSPEKVSAVSSNEGAIRTVGETVVSDTLQTSRSDTVLPVPPSATPTRSEPAKAIRTSSRPTERRTNATRPNRGSETTNIRSPRLLEYEEDQDDSLRLADLLEDIETSD